MTERIVASARRHIWQHIELRPIALLSMSMLSQNSSEIDWRRRNRQTVVSLSDAEGKASALGSLAFTTSWTPVGTRVFLQVRIDGSSLALTRPYPSTCIPSLPFASFAPLRPNTPSTRPSHILSFIAMLLASCSLNLAFSFCRPCCD